MREAELTYTGYIRSNKRRYAIRLTTIRETNDTHCNNATFIEDAVVLFPHAYARQLLIKQRSLWRNKALHNQVTLFGLSARIGFTFLRRPESSLPFISKSGSYKNYFWTS